MKPGGRHGAGDASASGAGGAIRGSILCYAPAAMKRQSVRMMLWYVRASPDGVVSDGAAAQRCWIGELGPIVDRPSVPGGPVNKWIVECTAMAKHAKLSNRERGHYGKQPPSERRDRPRYV
jgi:hypothetical protein